MAACPNCQHSVGPDEEICENCGAVIATLVAHQTAIVAGRSTSPLLANRNICPACKKPIQPDEEICEHCGIVLSSITTIVNTPVPAPDEAHIEGHCPRCQRRRKAGARFCNSCGLRYNENPQPSAEVTPPLEQVTLKAGDLLNQKYKIVQTIGEGGMGAVFLAEDQLLKRKVVIKTLLSMHDKDLIAQSIKEREFLAALKHTNIVTIYDFLTVGAQGYIVMEYVQGKTIEQIMDERSRPFEVAQAIHYILAILPAFMYLGKLDLVYCDFKPQNMMLEILKDGTEIAKLIDLGTVIKHEFNPPEVYGTNGYYAPEAVKTPSPETDLYSICRTLAFLVTEMDLATPFFGMPLMHAYKAFQTHPALYRLLVKGTHSDPTQRFHSAQQLSDQLSGVLRQIEGGPTEHPISSRLFISHQFTTMGKMGRRGETALNNNDPAIDLLRSGDRALQQGDFVTADNWYMQANRKNPGCIDAHLRLAEIALEQNEPEKALIAIQVAQKVDPTHWKIIWMQARLAEAKQKTSQAIDLYTQLCDELPGELPPQHALARVYTRSRNHSQAANLYKTILKADPLNSEALLEGAKVSASQGKWQEAANLLQKIPEESVHSIEARLLLCDIHLHHSASPGPKELELTFLTLQSLEGQTNDSGYYLVCGDFYTLLWKKIRHMMLPPGIVIPGVKKVRGRHLRALAEKNYLRYLQIEPRSVNREAILRKKLEVAPWRLF
jgi:serine/threonine-protein kinase PknG